MHKFKRHLLYIWLVAVLLLSSGCSSSTDTLNESEITTPPSTTEWEAVYLTLNGEENDFVNKESFADDILVVSTTEQLVEAFTGSLQPRILYLHPDTLEEVDSEWLKGLYRNGVIIAAINTPVSKLGQKLGVYTDINDLRMEYLTEERIIVSAFQRLNDPEQGTQGNRIITDYFENFRHASSALNIMAENPFTVGPTLTPLSTATQNKNE